MMWRILLLLLLLFDEDVEFALLFLSSFLSSYFCLRRP